jgi:Flp pilus assembly protein TadG
MTESTGQSHMERQAPTKTTSGQSTVELAIVLMLLALLLVGIADVARIFSEHLSVVNAAGVAARWSVLEPTNKACSYPSPYSNESDIALADLGPTLASQVTGVVTSTNGSPSSVTVHITYTHTYLFGLIRNVPLSFTGSATMPGVISTPGTCYSVPVPTNTSVPTFTPAPTSTPPPTVTPFPTSTPTATPTARLLISYLAANKQNGNGRPVYIKVKVTDESSVGQDNVTLSATVNTTQPVSGSWTYLGNGTYQLCPSTSTHNGNSPTVAVTASKAGYQNANGSVTAGASQVCPPNPPP